MASDYPPVSVQQMVSAIGLVSCSSEKVVTRWQIRHRSLFYLRSRPSSLVWTLDTLKVVMVVSHTFFVSRRLAVSLLAGAWPAAPAP